MKEFILPFTKRNVFVTFLIGLLAWIINQYVYPLQLNLIFICLLFFYAISSATYYVVIKTWIKNKKKFANSIMLSTMIRLVLSLLFFGIMVYVNKEKSKEITVWFLMVYLTYHLHFSITMNNINKKNVQ